MLLNRIEKMMNNPVRAALQRHFEAPRLRAMGGAVPGARVLEVGCGRGVGTGLTLDLRAEHVDAFDHDPAMVALARKRLAPRGARRAGVSGGREPRALRAVRVVRRGQARPDVPPVAAGSPSRSSKPTPL